VLGLGYNYDFGCEKKKKGDKRRWQYILEWSRDRGGGGPKTHFGMNAAVAG